MSDKKYAGKAVRPPALDQNIISPFLRAVKKVFSTMVHTEARAQPPRLLDARSTPGDVFALMLMRSDSLEGQLIIGFPAASLIAVANKMMMENFTKLEPLVTDTAGEIVNIVTGGAKLELAEQGYDFDMSQPGIYQATEIVMQAKIGLPRLIVPYESDCGSFYVDVGFVRSSDERNKKNKQEPSK